MVQLCVATLDLLLAGHREGTSEREAFEVVQQEGGVVLPPVQLRLRLAGTPERQGLAGVGHDALQQTERVTGSCWTILVEQL